jgi:hypothetical protein
VRASFLYRTIGLAAGALVAIPVIGGPGDAEDPRLGPPPTLSHPAALVPAPAPVFAPNSVVDTANRQAVVDFYRTRYLPALAVPNDWNGSTAGCNAGSTSVAYADATFQMVDYFRSMAGLPAAIARNATKDGKAQQAALMMMANNSLNHTPPPTWLCYTTGGAEAAGASNLASGVAGASAIALYIRDPGASNTAVGHRRWILYPPQTEMGTGSTSSYNALWVIGAFGARPPSPSFVAWPNPGFVPFPVVYPRWSFSVNSSGVDFATASVTMTRAGSPVGLTLLPLDTQGFGDQTIVWEPIGIVGAPGMNDTTYTVTVANVRVGGVPRQYTYDVTLIDPDSVSVTGVVPNVGPTAGGTPVSILGSRFGAPATVAFGGTPATAVNVVNSTTITAVTPAHSLGAVGVTVTVPGGISSTLADGYFYFDPPPPTRLHTLTPCRLVDTRNPVTGDGRGGPILAPMARRNFTLTGLCGIPGGAKALSVNLTVTGSSSAGHVSLFPGNGVAPATSNINFSQGQTRANNAVVLLATNGSGLLAALNGSSGPVHLILDVNGYFQ